jgi:hypothetical protein
MEVWLLLLKRHTHFRFRVFNAREKRFLKGIRVSGWNEVI